MRIAQGAFFAAIMVMLLSGCAGRSGRLVLDADAMGTPEFVAASAIVQSQQARELLGEEGVVLGIQINMGRGASQTPLLGDVIGYFSKETRMARYDAAGVAGRATLTVHLERRGRGTWRLIGWELEPVTVAPGWEA